MTFFPVYSKIFYGMFNEVIKKLNGISAETEARAKNATAVFTRFLFGNAIRLLSETLKAVAAGGKVVATYSEKSFDVYGAAATNAVKAAGFSVCNFITDGNAPSVDTAGGIVAVAEDARCIIAFDAENFGTVSYAAMIKGVPAILCAYAFGAEQVVSSRALLKNGEGWEYVKTCVPRYVVVDESAIDNTDEAAVYASVAGRITDFTDYRIACAVKYVNPDKRAYAIMKNATVSAFGITRFNGKERKARLAEYKLTSELANLAADGALSDYASSANAARICRMRGLKKEGDSIYPFRTAAGIFDLYFSGKYDDILEIPDYAERADAVASLLGDRDEEAMQAIKEQRAIYKKASRAEAKIKATLKDEIHAQNAAADKAVKTYLALGGTDDADKVAISRAVKRSGDLPKTFNCITLIRESGITEYIT